MPLSDAGDVPALQRRARLPLPAVLRALQGVREKTLLQFDAVIGIEVGPVLDAVRFEPLVLRRGAHEALEISARVQPLPSPVRRREEGHGDLAPVRTTPLVAVLAQRIRHAV